MSEHGAVSPNTRINLTLAGVGAILLTMAALWIKTLSWARTDAEFRAELRWRLTMVEGRLLVLEGDKCRCKPWQSAPQGVDR